MFQLDNDRRNVTHERVHEGRGVIGVKYVFENASAPALLITYTLPPGASEGLHTHRLGDAQLGSYDEFYYVIAGTGQMQIADQTIAIAAGDHVFVPNGVERGIENTAPAGDLKVYLVAIMR